MIYAPLLPRKTPEDDRTHVDTRTLCRAYAFTALAIALCTWLLCYCTGCAFTLSTVTTSANMGRAFEDPFSRGKTNWGASVTGQFTRDK